VPKLETIGEYKISTVPWSLCAVDGSLFIPTDKASFTHAVEDAKAKSPEDASQHHSQSSSVSVLIVYAMGVLQNMNKKLSYCWETVRRESMPGIAEIDVEMTS